MLYPRTVNPDEDELHLNKRNTLNDEKLSVCFPYLA